MSDFRDFNKAGESQPGMMSEKISRPSQIQDNGGLASFHHTDTKEETSSSARMVGVAVVALMACAAGAYTYMTWSPSSPAP